MCGVAGFWRSAGGDVEATGILSAMTAAIAHRGPNSEGHWLDSNSGIALGHRRLAVVDLSAAGHQPMCSDSGRFVLVYNGEIYNHGMLRKELERADSSLQWRGHSDTEVLLTGFEVWGIEATLSKCEGMFAFAMWDKSSHTLILGRDRLGEKPLYYGWQGDVFLFGSELKALKAHPAFRSDIDRKAVVGLMRFSAIPAPYSIYQGISKLPPGTVLRVSVDQRDAQPIPYWSANAIVAQGIAHPFVGSPQDAVAALDTLLTQTIGQQMLADVPLGAFLSGGVDSSVVVVLMQAQSMRPVRTFTIGFHEQAYDEAIHAKAVARHLGTEHSELYVSAQQALDVIPRLPAMFCEPFSDSSQIPTFLVSQLARQHVTVSLSGDGGDELFGGYSRYLLGNQWWHKLSYLPQGLRSGISRCLLSVPVHRWNAILQRMSPFLPSGLRSGAPGDRLHKGASVMAMRSLPELYAALVSHWETSEQLVLDASEPSTVLTDTSRQPKTDHAIHQMMAMDLVSYLPDDILTKVDRAAMAVSLESRVPLLDHRIVEFAWSLPLDYKVRGGVGKWPLREILYKHVPQALVDRPKMGFGVPIDSWLRGDLRPWAEELLSETRLKREGFFNPAPIRRKWAEHLSGQRNWQYHLWDVLMFQAWLEAQ
jgi:asparagine synthase (glutamine-hydrolysing)